MAVYVTREELDKILVPWCTLYAANFLHSRSFFVFVYSFVYLFFFYYSLNIFLCVFMCAFAYLLQLKYLVTI